MILLKGSPVANSIIEGFQTRKETLISKGITPKLTVVIIGNDPSAFAYIRMIQKGFEKQALHADFIQLESDISEAAFLSVLDELNHKDDVHGILVQMPLPRNFDENRVKNAISYKKDVDGFNMISAGKLLSGADTFYPCTPFGVMKILEYYQIELAGKHAVVIGRSNIVGKPAALLLLEKNCTVTICHSKTKDLSMMTQSADILVAAIGKKEFVDGTMIKEGAVVIDVGIHDFEGKLYGDVDQNSVAEIAGALTPVPGGVGSTTIAILMENVIKAAEMG